MEKPRIGLPLIVAGPIFVAQVLLLCDGFHMDRQTFCTPLINTRLGLQQRQEPVDLGKGACSVWLCLYCEHCFMRSGCSSSSAFKLSASRDCLVINKWYPSHWSTGQRDFDCYINRLGETSPTRSFKYFTTLRSKVLLAFAESLH